MNRNSPSLPEYVESYSLKVLHLDETTGDICWKDDTPLPNEKRRKYRVPNVSRNPRSRSLTLHDGGDYTRHAKRWGNQFRTSTQETFLVRSTLAHEGVVGLMYLWKWVKRMIAQPHWQKVVAVVEAPRRGNRHLWWYTLGIRVTGNVTTLKLRDRSWTI